MPHHLKGVWMYCDLIIEYFRDGDAPRHLYGQAAFEVWWEGYVMEQQGFRAGTGGLEDPDDWRAVPSPYKV